MNHSEKRRTTCHFYLSGRIIISVMIGVLGMLLFTACGGTQNEQNNAAAAVKNAGVPEQQSPSALKQPKEAERTEWISTPDSTAFNKIGYDADNRVLIVVFRDSGTTYEYADFPENEWDAFKNADSKGKWFNAKIKPNYDYSEKY